MSLVINKYQMRLLKQQCIQCVQNFHVYIRNCCIYLPPAPLFFKGEKSLEIGKRYKHYVEMFYLLSVVLEI